MLYFDCVTLAQCFCRLRVIANVHTLTQNIYTYIYTYVLYIQFFLLCCSCYTNSLIYLITYNMTDNLYRSIYTWTRSLSLFTQAEKSGHTNTRDASIWIQCTQAHVEVLWRRWQCKEKYCIQYSVWFGAPLVSDLGFHFTCNISARIYELCANFGLVLFFHTHQLCKDQNQR